MCVGVCVCVCVLLYVCRPVCVCVCVYVCRCACVGVFDGNSVNPVYGIGFCVNQPFLSSYGL